MKQYRIILHGFDGWNGNNDELVRVVKAEDRVDAIFTCLDNEWDVKHIELIG